MLCLVCSLLSPSPKASLANRAAKTCAAKMGVMVVDESGTGLSPALLSPAAIRLCELVADRLLMEVQTAAADNAGIVQVRVGNYATSNRFPTTSSSSSSQQQSSSSSSPATISMEFIEASTWLLRSCGKHERAIDILSARMQQQQQLHGQSTRATMVGFWSPIKYESYTATHLGEVCTMFGFNG